MSEILKIGGACLNQIPLDWANNISNILAAIDSAKKEGVRILCLPELCITGYGCEDMFLSPWLPDKALEKIRLILPHTQGIFVSVGLPVRIADKVYNTSCLMADQKILGFYAKQKLANDGVHYEPRWFEPWPSGEVISFPFLNQNCPFGQITLDYAGIRIGFEICEDAWREDRPACHKINKGVHLLLNPSASHFAFGKASFRENLVIKSSSTFDCVYLYTNLLGNEAGRMIYDGDILIAQKGELKGRNRRLSFKAFNLTVCDIDFTNPQRSTTAIREDWQNPMEEFGRVQSLALFDYLRKSRSRGFVLSLSGGADSSCIAVLVAEMVRLACTELGVPEVRTKLNLTSKSIPQLMAEVLHVAYQGTVNSSDETLDSARTLAQSVDATFYHWHIDQPVDQYRLTIESALGRTLQWDTDDIALQNIQARARSPIIWMLANIKGALLLSTSNRSEGDVGYATMDGDTSGSISPIAGVSKSFILQWLKYAEETLNYKGLNKVNQLTPTAELKPLSMHQTDEADLMPYNVLVEIEEHAIRNRMSPLEVFKKMKTGKDEQKLVEWITKFYTLWSRNQWKRERIAPGFHLDDFNIDPRTWCRFPILSGGFSEELEELKTYGTGS